MIIFNEPEDKFGFVKDSVGDKKSQIRRGVLGFLVLSFLSSVILVSKTEFSFDTSSLKTELVPLETVCKQEYSRGAFDDREKLIIQGNKVIKENQSVFKTLRGFDEAVVDEAPLGYQHRMIPVLRIDLVGVNSPGREVPAEICGFKTVVTYK